MVKESLISLSLIFIAVPGLLSAQPEAESSEALAEGRKAVRMGEIDQAADLWSHVLNQTGNTPADPRIAISYLELITAHEMKDHYDDAQENYFRVLSDPVHSGFREEMKSEIERLRPIADNNTYKFWNGLLKDKKFGDLGDSVTLFWKQLDPTPGTVFNERLAEHWRRIAYAKKHFTRSRSTVYETDDRALIYIKLGEPDRKENGTIGYNKGQVEMWIQEALLIDTSPDPVPATVGSDSLLEAIRNANIQANWAAKRAMLSSYERQVWFKHSYPSYEIWVYESIPTRGGRNLIYIFGEDDGNGRFGLRRSMEDMLPSSSFRSEERGMSVPSSLFLQLLYYQEVMKVDPFFADAFRELESRVYGLQEVGRWDSFQLRSRNLNALAHNQTHAPVQRSSILNSFPEIPLDIHQYRLLNEEGEPYLATFLYCRPYRAYYVDRLKTESFGDTGYRLTGFAMAADRDNRILFQDRSGLQNLDSVRDFYGSVDSIEPEVIYFAVPHTPVVSKQRFTVELQHEKKDSTTFGDNLFKENIRALGAVSAGPAEEDPVSTDNTGLEMGDLILGVEGSEKVAPFGFRPQPEAVISEGENLIVHLEIYHLRGTPEQAVPFQIEYTVSQKEGFFKRLFGRRSTVKLDLNFESRSPHFRENLIIDTSPFEPGEYTLDFTARETEGDRTVNRSVKFTIEGE